MYRQLRPDEIWKPALLMAVVLAWVLVQAHPWLLLVVAAPFALGWMWQQVTVRWCRWKQTRREDAERDAAVAEYVRKYGGHL